MVQGNDLFFESKSYFKKSIDKKGKFLKARKKNLIFFN